MGYNGDLPLGDSKKQLYSGGAQRKGNLPSITQSEDYIGRITQATHLAFPLTPDIEIPAEIKDSLEWIAKTDTEVASSFSGNQLYKLQKLTNRAQLAQNQRGDRAHMEIKWAQSKFKSVAYRQLLSNLNL